MANRRFVQFSYALENKVVRLFAKATIGAAGAITLDTKNSKGIGSIVKQATAGQYKITMQDGFKKLLGIDSVVQNATGVPASGTMGVMTAGTVVGQAAPAAIFVQFSNGGTATNLASGDVVYLEIVFGDSDT